MKLINVYTTSFYGSCLWNLLSKDVGRIFTSWNVTVRNVFSLDRKTHRFLIETLSGCMHLKTMLLSRFVGFHHELVKSPKFCIRFLARLQEKDLRTSMGRTLHYLLKQCKIDDNDLVKLTHRKVKSSVLYTTTNTESAWSINLANELHNIRNKTMGIRGFTEDEIDEMFNFVCTN